MIKQEILTKVKDILSVKVELQRCLEARVCPVCGDTEVMKTTRLAGTLYSCRYCAWSQYMEHTRKEE